MNIDNVLSNYFGNTTRLQSLNITREGGVFRIMLSIEVIDLNSLLVLLNDKSVLKSIKEQEVYYDFSESKNKTLSYVVVTELLYGNKLTGLILENFNVR